MNVLVLYATIEGQTEKIARFVADEVRKSGHEALLQNADNPDAIKFDTIDGAVLLAPVHQRRHPRNFEALLFSYGEKLSARPTLLLSVSLNASFPEGREEAGEYVTEMNMRTGFTADKTLLVAGAVRTTQYDYFAMQVVRHVVLKDQPIDSVAAEHEFTDWTAVKHEVDAFVGGVG